jgi:hypothetical protein
MKEKTNKTNIDLIKNNPGEKDCVQSHYGIHELIVVEGKNYSHAVRRALGKVDVIWTEGYGLTEKSWTISVRWPKGGELLSVRIRIFRGNRSENAC